MGIRQTQPIFGSGAGRTLGLEVIPPPGGGAGAPPDEPSAPPVTPLDLSAPKTEGMLSAVEWGDAQVEGAVLGLRLKGVPATQIAPALGVPLERVRRILRTVRVDKRLNDVLVDLTHDALPRAVEQLIAKIDQGKDWAIKDTLKGLGAFRSYRQQETHRETEDLRTLHVTFETPASPVLLNPANIVGVPRAVPREVIDAVPIGRPTEILPQSGREAGGDLAGGGEGMGRGLEGADGAGAGEDAHGQEDADPLAGLALT